MKKAYIALVAGWLLAIGGTAQARDGEVGIGIKAGTLGGGFEIGLDLMQYIEIRAGYNQVSFEFDTTISQVDYIFTPDFSTASLLLDFHPFANAFHFTAGVYLNNNEMDIDGIYRKDFIPEHLIRYADLVDQTKIKGKVEFENFAPYLGIGWTSNHDSKSRWGVNMDLGIMFQGAPEVTDLHIEDPWGFGDHSTGSRFIEQERRAIESEIDGFEYYPVASISISCKF
ncbi:MAG: hypothetical protein D3924_07130 [Candidatus Electrothrix sp. AR4]|nr:hypothetical protein [Candidatus Electrothrix sp. AR4]